MNEADLLIARAAYHEAVTVCVVADASLITKREAARVALIAAYTSSERRYHKAICCAHDTQRAVYAAERTCELASIELSKAVVNVANCAGWITPKVFLR